MAVESTMVPLGSALPSFTLPDLAGTTVSSEQYLGKPLLVAFVSNHCPYVRHVERGFAALATRHEQDLSVLAICTNDADAYPQDGPIGLAEQVDRALWEFPYLIDTTQEVGRTFGAACTPDFFLYDADGRLAYRGAMDASTPGNGLPVTGDLLEDAVSRVVAGKPVPEPHRPSMGCSIKWRE
ncbi:thioredoxin family protein [Isoptericola sp. b441]|uniref:Thioredoxin family protein n=1 Tax=Actinotalea lenta TaxID=3064654 RepID=A0ABT9D4K9_9CELL|nr:thioredoxin family protein [Isoptericola sp. b441]MDO8105619.1 thioredoxin family protein [Isoptericola sp. b441]